nr:PAS domain S-box protein [uncultured Dongia sp.]
MSTVIRKVDDGAPVSMETVAFLAELARLPDVQKGDFEAVAKLACERCLKLVAARYVSVWMLDPARTCLRSVMRYDSSTGRRCADINIPIEHIVDELAVLQTAALIVSDDALADPRLIGIRDGYLREHGITAALQHVIRVSGEDIGLFSFEQIGTPQPWSPADSALARGVCSYLALTSVNRQKSDLQQQSATTAALQAAILENAAHAVVATDVDGVITFFNRAAEQMLGYRADEVVHKATPALFHDASEVAARSEQLSRDLGQDIKLGFGVFVAKTLAGLPNEEEWTYIRRDGGRLSVMLSITAIRGKDGTIDGFLGMASDITERNRVSKQLRQSEEILSRVLLQSPDAILITALVDGRILEVNPGFEQITGYSRAEALGHTTVDLSIWVDLTERNAMLKQVRETGEVRSMPVLISRRGGDRRHCILWGRTFDHGGTAALLTSVHDITDIKEAEQAARESQRMLQSVLNTIPSRVFWKDRDSVYLGCNQQFANGTGFASPHEIIGKTDLDLVWRDDARNLIDGDRSVMTTLTPILDREMSYIGLDGERRWFEVNKIPLMTETGDVTGVLGVQHDITEKLKRQRELRASEEKLRSLFALSPLGINLQEMTGRYIETNDAFLKIVGFTREELFALTCYDLIPDQYLVAEPDRLRLLQETGLIPAYEKEYTRKDGSLVPVSTSTVLVSGPDGQNYKWTIVEDITNRRVSEEAQRQLNEDLARLVAERSAELQVAMEGLMRSEKLASLGSLVAGVAHEISTPVGNASLATSTLVGAIGAFEQELAGKLSRSSLDGFVKQVKLGVDIANRNIERVAGLIQSFKQVAVDQTSSQRRQFHLTEVVDEIVTTMHPSLKRSFVTMDISIPATLVLDSYPGPLGQILTNLINNSLIHAFPKDAPVKDQPRIIAIKAIAIDSANLRLEISDNGAGMPATALSRVFDPFFTSKLGQGGSGLGLHIVHNIITGMLAGAISVASKIGVGTTFSIVMPCDTPKQPVVETSS